MSDFIVSARKYRPSTFANVVGQEALTTTLKNAILNNKLSHAYLFCGPRGVGKTSCARIFAKTINCEKRTPEGEACNECESCRAANEQRSYNITELDAASNNSVNDIRQLIEQVYIAPVSGKYRVYIIDEVHMLSSSAFNAFLKTLEEPPAHAIFVLATTEKHKVLPTIISRCQVHDFSRITSNDIANHLQRIADAEQITAEHDALQVIGIAADGGMRDALSMFDQIAGFGGGKITLTGVRQNLNLLDEDDYFLLLAYILMGSHSQVLTLIDRLLVKGYEADIIMRGFSSFLRNVLLAQSHETISIIEVPRSIKERMIKAGEFTPAYLLWEFLKISTNFSSQYKNSSDKRLTLEVALLCMCEKVSTSSLVTPDVLSGGTTNRVSPPKVEALQTRQAEITPTPPTNANPTKQVVSPTTPQSSSHTSSQPKPIVGTSNKDRYAFNLITGQRPIQEEEKNYEKPKKNRREAFTQEELLDAWRSFAHSKNIIISKILDRQDNPPILLEDEVIQYNVGSKVEKEQVEDLLGELQTFLSDTLNNDFLAIRLVLTQDNNNAPLAQMTLSEKFDVLKQNNPWIGRFSSDLDLSISN